MVNVVLRGLWGWWEVGMVDRWGWRWIYRKTGGVAEMKDNDVKGGRRVVWSPQERQAEFMQRGEYEALYGGAAGGGKSDALLAEALRQADKACYRGIIFRKTYPQLTELEDRSQTLYKGAYPAARYNKTKHCWSFPSGAKIYFGAMQHKKDRLNYQGKHYDFVGFDELTQFSFDEYSYMFSRNRPGGKGTRVYIRATANPGGPGHSWVKQRFITAGEPMKPIIEEHKVKKPDGAEIIIRKSRVFIPASVFDNKELLRNDPEYLASLSMLPTAERKALLYGDWNSFTGQVFTEWRDDPEHYCDRRWTHVIQEAGSKLSRDMIKGTYFAFQQVCYLIIELIRQFYDTPRSFRITGGYDAFDKSAIKEQSRELFGVQLGTKKPVFDIVCTASKKSPFSKASQNELAKQLFQLGFFNPETAVQALGCLAMMDFEGKEEIERVIRDNAGMNEVKI